ncbi:MAG TPA: DMT family transporter [Candidatus Limnocylindrales bacterium]|nr:DMT family transporter [Candidatus Limnocylindrales bacterium]
MLEIFRPLVTALVDHPRLTALLAALFIAASGVIYRFADVTADTATFFRAFYGLPLLAAVALLEMRRSRPLSIKARLLSVVAGAFFALDLFFWHHAIDAVGAGMATVLGNLQVVIVAIAAWLIFGERPTRRTLAALPIILAGVVLIAGVIGAGTYGIDPPLGVLLGVLTAIAYAAYLLIIRPINRTRTAEPVAIATASTAGVALALGLGTGQLNLIPSWPEHGWLVLLGVTAQSVAYLLISISLPRLPAVTTSIILLGQPVAAIFLAMLLVGESPSVAQLTGVGLVIAGIAMATFPLARLRRRAMPVTTP